MLGTTGILKAIARSAPSVRRVVITSSFAAILDKDKVADPATTFTEASWNPVTLADIHASPADAYRASKKLAERAAWDFVSDGGANPGFDLVTINPPMVFGPVVHYLAGLDAINTSNERFVGLVQGRWKEGGIPETGTYIWTDVRDVALAHVLAFEKPELGGKRLFVTSGFYCNHEILDVVRKNFPALKDQLPGEDVKGGELPAEDKLFKLDNSETTKALGIKWATIEKTTVDTINSLLPFLK